LPRDENTITGKGVQDLNWFGVKNPTCVGFIEWREIRGPIREPIGRP